MNEVFIVHNNISLLCRNWKLPICFAAIIYLIVQSSIIFHHLFAESTACRSPDFSSWTWHVNFFELTSFSVVLALQGCHLALKIIAVNEFGSYAATFFVSLLAGISSMIRLCTDWTGNCDDAFGVRFPEVLWAEWIACVPLLYFIVLATDIKPCLTKFDIIILILITMTFVFGIILRITNSFILSVFLLIATVCCFTVGEILFYFVTISNREYFSRIRCETVRRNEYEIRLKNTQAKLALCLLLILPLFPFVYFLSLFRVINHDITYTIITFLNVVAKLLFCNLMNSAHHNVMAEVIRLQLVAESLALKAETAANESRRLFVRYIMHEVRVPLSSITMGIGFLGQCPEIDDEAKEALLMMEGATGFMKQTLNDVLNMQRIEEGKLQLDFQPFSIEKVINRVKASLHGIIQEKNINLIIKIRSGVPELVIGDGFRIEHVIVNIVSNAMKFSSVQSEVVVDIGVALDDIHLPNSISENDHENNKRHHHDLDGSSRYRFGFSFNSGKKVPTSNECHNMDINSEKKDTPRATASTNTTTIIFSVIDNGPGISESDVKTLFLPFSQIRPHELQSGGGSGIGLVICKQIVELHGGSISCQSELGIGSTFVVTIPFEVVLGGEGGGANSDRVISQVIQGNDCRPISIQDDDATLPNTQQDASCDPFSNSTKNCTIAAHLDINNKNDDNKSIINSNNILILQQSSGITTLCSDDDEADDNIFADKNHQRNVQNNNINDKFEIKKFDDQNLVILPNAKSSIVLSELSVTLPLYQIDDGSNSTSKSDNNGNNRCSRGNSNNLLSPSLVGPVISVTETVKKKPMINQVLLVDDVSSNRRILSMLLRQRGIASTMAVNGQEGVNAVKEGNQSFDLIFMDNSMPIMNGVEATKCLRSLGFPHLIIGVTGNAMEEDVSEYIEAGADAVILKPVSILQINQILEYAEKNGNSHVSGYKIVFTDTHYYSMKL